MMYDVSLFQKIYPWIQKKKKHESWISASGTFSFFHISFLNFIKMQIVPFAILWRCNNLPWKVYRYLMNCTHFNSSSNAFILKDEPILLTYLEVLYVLRWNLIATIGRKHSNITFMNILTLLWAAIISMWFSVVNLQHISVLK